jgi:hypothetical protein
VDLDAPIEKLLDDDALGEIQSPTRSMAYEGCKYSVRDSISTTEYSIVEVWAQ